MNRPKVSCRFWHTQSKSPRKLALRRRLAVESLERRALLSVAAGSILSTFPPTIVGAAVATATQHLSVADLPSAAQQAISTALNQDAKLTASDGAADDDGFGDSVAISGNTVVVGADWATIGSNTDQGAAYVFTASAAGWADMTQVAKLTASDGAAGDLFGNAVAISGNTVVVGSQRANRNTGAAYVFSEPATGWADMTQTAKLTAANGAVGADFGNRWIAISGDTVVVGAQYQDAAFVFTEPAAGWTNMTQTAKLTASNAAPYGYLGYSVAIDGSTVVAGAPNLLAPGAAYVFTKPAAGWANMTQTAILSPSTGATDDNVGSSVAISGNTVVASGPGVDYVFTKPGGGWTNVAQTAKLTASGSDGTGNEVAISGSTIVAAGGGAANVFTEPVGGWADMSETAKLAVPSGTAVDFFANAISISGNTLVVGADSEGDVTGQRAAFTFTAPGAGWANAAQAAELTARRTASDGPVRGDLGDSVSISGDTLVVGAPDAAVGVNTDQGAAYVFTRSGSAWLEIAELTASDGMVNDDFGTSVSISGNTIVVGEPGAYFGVARAGAAYVFSEPATGWANMTQTAKLTPSDGAEGDLFGDSVAVSGNTVVVGADGACAGEAIAYEGPPGAAYVFAEPAAGWANMTQTAKLTAANTASDDDFGWSVAISGNTVVVGAAQATVGGNIYQGAAYVFTEPAAGWADMTQTAMLTASDGAAWGDFGDSVSISGNTVVVGSYPFERICAGLMEPAGYQPPLVVVHGAAYVFTEPGGGWADMTQTAKLTVSDDAGGNDGFGDSVAICGNTIVVGANEPYPATHPSSAYVFAEPAAGWASATQTVKLAASDGAAYDGFGTSVSLSGNTVVVGSPDSNICQGAAYVFDTAIDANPPAITSAAVISATVGRKYAYQVETSAVAGQTITFSLVTAPAGMSINASTGLVTWVPTAVQAGSSTVTVLARDQYGYTTQQTFSVSVSGVSTPYNPFALRNRHPVLVGPARGGAVVGTTSGPTPASLKNSVVDQLLASSGADWWL
jgi:hypothetical protein